ncbi:MAG: hypothetical protein Ct9H300mP9_1420 [Candidatus Neomarinimicrobiota bacterium]|nr:MAG: hypothetical protein Ct9H300mP9_1420 [Candidatus Neomarinimicrobiota bacterium]
MTRSFHDPTELSSVRNELCQELHPYSDGRSSERLIDTIDEILSNDSLGELKTKNPNWIQRRRVPKNCTYMKILFEHQHLYYLPQFEPMIKLLIMRGHDKLYGSICESVSLRKRMLLRRTWIGLG